MSVLWRESRNSNENTIDGLIHVKPRHSFQDLVSNSKWASCDFSGDGEYVVGGCNNDESGDKYELYFWNTVNGKYLKRHVVIYFFLESTYKKKLKYIFISN